MSTLLRWLERAGMGIAIVATAIIMLLVSMDATLRYTMNMPLRWVFEIVTYYLMVIALYFALSSTFTRGDHVNISLLRDMMPAKLRNTCDVVWVLASALVFAIAAWGTAHHAIEAWNNNDFIPGFILWPSWLSHLPIPMGFALITLRLIHHALTLMIKGEDPSVESHGEIVE